MAQLIKEWVMSCKQCIKGSPIESSPTHSPLQNLNEHITAPENAMQIDLVPDSHPSGGYETIVTAMNVFSCYSFAYSKFNQDARTNAKVIVNIAAKHPYLPTTLISAKGSAFVSHVNKEMAGVHGIFLKHATTKHAQAVGMLERSHPSIN